MSVEQKIKSLGHDIPEPPKSVASYVPAVQTGNLIFVSGQLPFIQGALKYTGKVGSDLSKKEAYDAAVICTLNCLSVIKAQIGSLDNIKKIVKVTGYVSSSLEFKEQHTVLNGASELLAQVFFEGRNHARAAVGVNELPLGASVEVEMIVEV